MADSNLSQFCGSPGSAKLTDYQFIGELMSKSFGTLLKGAHNINKLKWYKFDRESNKFGINLNS